MPAPYPILFLIRELHLGGTEQQFAETILGLDRTRFEPHVGCFIDQGIQAGRLRAAGIPIVRFPVTSFKNTSLIHGARALRSYVRHNNIRIVHTFDVPMNVFGVFSARLARVPIVISSQRAQRLLDGSAMRSLLRISDKMVHRIVVNSKLVRGELMKNDNVPETRIRTVYNGVDAARFHPEGRVRPESVADASLVIGTICEFRPEKSLSTLVEAFAQVLKHDPRLKLLLVGDGPVKDQVRQHVRELGIESSTVFEPATRDVPPWMRAIDIFVLPSLFEAFSNALMEAMASGCAVIASNVGGNPELVTDQETGLLYPAGDTNALAALLKKLIDDSTLRARLAGNAWKHVHTSFSKAASLAAMQGVYAELLGER